MISSQPELSLTHFGTDGLRTAGLDLWAGITSRTLPRQKNFTYTVRPKADTVAINKHVT